VAPATAGTSSWKRSARCSQRWRGLPAGELLSAVPISWAAIAVTKAESAPPLRNVPSRTSEIRCRRTACLTSNSASASTCSPGSRDVARAQRPVSLHLAYISSGHGLWRPRTCRRDGRRPQCRTGRKRVPAMAHAFAPPEFAVVVDLAHRGRGWSRRCRTYSGIKHRPVCARAFSRVIGKTLSRSGHGLPGTERPIRSSSAAACLAVWLIGQAERRQLVAVFNGPCPGSALSTSRGQPQ
jgi:hypothetical protein